MWVDEHLLAVDKPAGLPTLPDGYNPEAPYLKGVLEPTYGRLWVVHRLDRHTSGVIVLARNAQAHRSLNTQFERHTVEKIYHALVHGDPGWVEKVVDLPLRANGDRRHRTIVDPQGGKPAITHLRCLERFGAFTLVEAAPRTGRTHQIRAHLATAGYPLVADELYGGHLPDAPSLQADAPPGLTRPGLHAWSLAVAHPVSGEALHLHAPYPADLEAALQELRRNRLG